MGVTACGDDDDDDAGVATTTTEARDQATTTPTTASGTGTATTVAAAGDQALVQELVLRASDLPPGWTSSPATDREDETADRELATCLGVAYDPSRPDAQSPDFSQGDLNQINSTAELAPSAEVAAAELAAIKAPKGVECLKQQFDKQLAQESGGVPFSPVQVATRSFPTVGDESFALRITTSVTPPDGQPIPIYLDVVLVRKGRAGMALILLAAGQPPSSTLAADLAQKLAARA